MWPYCVFVNATGVAVAAVSVADVTDDIGAVVTVTALSLSALLFWLLPMLPVLSVVISVAARDVDIDFCYSWFARVSCSNLPAGVVVVAALVIVSVALDVAVADFTVVSDIAVMRGGGVFVDIYVIGVDSDGRVRVIRRVEVIIAVLAGIVIDGGIGNTGLKWRGAARM